MDGNLTELSRLTAEVGRFCRDASLDDSAEFNLNLVLEELFANAVAHGGCKGMQDAVTFRLAHRTDGGVTIDYADRGGRFDPSSVSAPDLGAPLGERRAGGLGLHFVRSLCRIVQYHRDDGWNRLELNMPRESL